MQIDTVIFDLGRVLIGITPTGAQFGALMRSMGIPPEQAFDKYWYRNEVQRHMTGEMDSESFYRTAREAFGLDIGFEEFAAAWCDIFYVMPGMDKLFGEIADRYNLGLLSDTDPLHWKRARELCPWLDRIPNPTLSYQVGFLKPHPAMFAAAAADCDRDSRHCLFIDDLIANVDGARYYGMPALHFINVEKLRHDLAGLHIL